MMQCENCYNKDVQYIKRTRRKEAISLPEELGERFTEKAVFQLKPNNKGWREKDRELETR